MQYCVAMPAKIVGEDETSSLVAERPTGSAHLSRKCGLASRGLGPHNASRQIDSCITTFADSWDFP